MSHVRVTACVINDSTGIKTLFLLKSSLFSWKRPDITQP